MQAELRNKVSESLRGLTVQVNEAGRLAQDKADSFENVFEQMESEQTSIDEQQEKMISEMARVARRHATQHTMKVSQAELEIHSLQTDLKQMKRFIERTHTADVS